MMSSMTLIVGLVVLLTMTIQDTYGCSCMPSHPQEQFCRSNFVIKAKVLSHRWIYETKEPTHEPATTWQQVPTTPVPDITTAEVMDIDNEIPMQRFRKALPPLPSLEEAMKGRPQPMMQAWRVKVIKVYKGLDYMKEKEYVELFTPPIDSLCGVELLEMDEHYVFTGNSRDERLNINACGWTQTYKTLTSKQRHGLKKGYSTGCGECRIQTCFGKCVALPNADICTWMPFMKPDCEALYSKCIRSKKGGCGWHRNKLLKECQGEDEDETEQ
ncbi:metalloproteinase inhibitor 3-like isoform X2 [Saccoglossus kowalevskii]